MSKGLKFAETPQMLVLIEADKKARKEILLKGCTEGNI
jgi:hypothetical protein